MEVKGGRAARRGREDREREERAGEVVAIAIAGAAGSGTETVGGRVRNHSSQSFKSRWLDIPRG